MLLLAVSVWGSASQTPPAGNEHKQTDQANAHANKETAKPENSPNAVIGQQIINSEPSKHPSKDETADTAQHPHDWIDKLNAFSTFVIAAFTIFLFWGVVLQIRTSRHIERAWLTIKVGDIVQGELEFRYAKVPIKNTGRTPARVKRIVVTSMLIPFPKQGWGRPGELPTEFTLGHSDHTMVVEGRDFVIPPGGEHMMYAMIFNTEWGTLTKKLSEGKQSWYVYGFVEYFDTIKGREIHKTGFCEIYWVADEPSKDVEGFRFTANLIPRAYICAT